MYRIEKSRGYAYIRNPYLLLGAKMLLWFRVVCPRGLASYSV